MSLPPAFTPWSSFIGGLMLAGSTTSLLALQGTILGISGIAHGVVQSTLQQQTNKVESKGSNPSSPTSARITWRHAAFAGLLLGGVTLSKFQSSITSVIGAPIFDNGTTSSTLPRMLLAGLLVGSGTKLGSGCTSGHMLCGMSRLSRRSIVAVMTFFSTAILTAHASPITMAFNPASPFSSLPAMDLSSALPVLAALQIPLVLAWLPLSSSEHVKSFLLSMHFSFGLALAGMLRPSKVISFFYFPLEVLSRTLPAPRAWDPSLAMVALGGLIPNALLWRFFIRKWNKPVTPGSRFQLPTKTFVDAKLVVGAILFGIGWGLSGLCPGPLFVSIGAGRDLSRLLPFAAAFAVGGQLVAHV